VSPTPSNVAPDGDATPVPAAELRYGPDGLLPVIVRDVDGDVLMLAYMDREALERTLADGTTVFFSRSRGALWPKGATSGHVQRVVAVAVDCDADALLVTVDQTGVACHTGEPSCFHRSLDGAPGRGVAA
jgi:phosphoribosyl-ATP pyrophosphohydrolase/phosphoribosyl-AMP cyclohydrolase